MDRLKAKNLQSLQNIIDEMGNDPKLIMNQTFSLKSSSDMIKNFDKYISSYRRNNKMGTMHNPSEKRKKKKSKVPSNNFISIDSAKHSNNKHDRASTK